MPRFTNGIVVMPSVTKNPTRYCLNASGNAHYFPAFMHFIHCAQRGPTMLNPTPATYLAFLINLSAWLFRHTPTHQHRLLERLQLYPTPLLKAVVHAQQIVSDTKLTLETLRTLDMPRLIEETLNCYALRAEENPLERRERLAANPHIVAIMIIKLDHALEQPDLQHAEYLEFQHERAFWLAHQSTHTHVDCSPHPSSCHA